MSIIHLGEDVMSYTDLLRQRGLTVHDRALTDDGNLRIESRSPVGEGFVLVERVRQRSPWSKWPVSKAASYKVTYAGDGDWIRLARSCALDGLMWAMRPDPATLYLPSGGAFGEVSEVDDTVCVRVHPLTEDPILERSHEITVWVGERCFPPTFLTPPFGVRDLERRVAQTLEYAPLDGLTPNFRCPECGDMRLDGTGSRQVILSSLKTGLCHKCLATALSCGGPTLPIEPKGWRS